MVLPTIALNLEQSDALIDAPKVRLLLSEHEEGVDYCLTQINTPFSNYSKWKLLCIVIRRDLKDAKTIAECFERRLMSFKPKQVMSALEWDAPRIAMSID